MTQTVQTVPPRVRSPLRGRARRPRRLSPEPPPTPPWWRSAADLLVVAVVVAGVTPWMLAGGPARLLGPERLESLVQLAGDLCAALVLLQLLFMARVPLLEKSIGHLELVSWHRTLGVWSITMLVAHVVILGVDKSAGTVGGAVQGLTGLITNAPWMPLATLATVGMLLVYVTSVKPFRNKLPYEWWHLIHLYGFLGAGLAVPHEIALGESFSGKPVTSALWVLAWIAVGLCVIIWRVGAPLLAMRRHGFAVRKIVPEAPGVWSLHVGGHQMDELGARAGQFFFVRFIEGTSVGEAHPYSLSAAPRNDELRFTVKDLGDGSGSIGSVPPGTTVLLEGPYGRFTSEARTSSKVLLLAAGIGVTPVRALLEGLKLARGDATLLYRASSEQEIVFREELERLCEEKGAELFFLVGPRNPRRQSFLPASFGRRADRDVLRELVPDVARRDVFLCGSGPWVEAAVDACLDAGVDPARLNVESFL